MGELDIDLEAELASLGKDDDDDMLKTLYGNTPSTYTPSQPEKPKAKLIECAYCGEIIKERVVHGLKHSYHPDHFLCSQCLNPLTSDVYFEKKGKAYCEKVSPDLTPVLCGGLRTALPRL